MRVKSSNVVRTTLFFGHPAEQAYIDLRALECRPPVPSPFPVDPELPTATLTPPPCHYATTTEPPPRHRQCRDPYVYGSHSVATLLLRGPLVGSASQPVDLCKDNCCQSTCVIINHYRIYSKFLGCVACSSLLQITFVVVCCLPSFFVARHSVRPAHQVGQTVRPSSPSSHPGGMSGHPARQASYLVRSASLSGVIIMQLFRLKVVFSVLLAFRSNFRNQFHQSDCQNPCLSQTGNASFKSKKQEMAIIYDHQCRYLDHLQPL